MALQPADTEVDMYADGRNRICYRQNNGHSRRKVKKQKKFYKLPVKQLHIFIGDYELEVVRVEKVLV